MAVSQALLHALMRAAVRWQNVHTSYINAYCVRLYVFELMYTRLRLHHMAEFARSVCEYVRAIEIKINKTQSIMSASTNVGTRCNLFLSLQQQH